MVIVLLVFTLDQVFGILPINPVAAAVTQFSFASAGDYGFSSAAKTVMSSMGSSGASFALGVGDLLYTQPTSTVNEKTWCNQFKTSIPNVELIVGNHETWETNSTDGGGSINKFVLDCPFTLGAETGTYGFRYYFDYPSTNPLARFIMVDPAIWNGTTSSSSLSYASGTANYNWVANAVDNARSNAIPWVIVVMHKICIGTGSQGCEVPMSFLTMLMNKRVDLILQGHDHTYQRSKQLTCATDGTYVSSCVANPGSSLTKGAGTVYVIDGTGGEGGGKTVSKPNTGYFAAYCCSTGTPLGYSLFTITSSSLLSTFVNTGGQTYKDSFTITGSSPPPNPSFTVSASPASVSFASGHSATSKITVNSVNGFAGTVSLSASVLPSSGLTALLNPSSFNVPKGGSASSTLTVSSSTWGNYVVNVTAVSGSLIGFTTVNVKVSDFSISANPSSLSFAVKSSASSTITVTSLNGFSGAVSLSATSSPSGISLSFTNGSVSVPTNSSASSILKVKSDKTGTYTVSVAGNAGGGLTHKVVLTVTVTTSQPAPDFGIMASPSSVAFNSGTSGGTTATLTGSSGFAGTLTITTVVNPSSGLSASCSPSSITLSSSTPSASSICTFVSSVTATYTVTVSASNGTLTRSTLVTVHVGDFSISVNPSTVSSAAGSSASATVTLSSIEQFTGTVALTVTPSSNSVSATVSPSSLTIASGGSATSTLSLGSNTAGTYTVQVTGASGSLSHSATVTYNVGAAPDFMISTSPTSVRVNAGTAGTSTITVSSLNGFNGAVSLTASVSPSTGLTCNLNPTSVTTPSGGSATSSLSCSGSAGTYTVTVTGTSGNLSHTAIVTYTVQDFTIAASPTSVSIIAGGAAGTSTITATGLNGFTGPVSLTSAVTGGTSGTTTCTLSPTSVTLGNSGTSTLSCSASPTASGSFTITVTGTSGSLSHNAIVTYNVGAAPDFTINANPSSVTTNLGVAGTSMITVGSQNGFNSAVALTATISPSSGLTCSLSPSNVTPTSGGSVTSTLSCTGATTGSYSVTVNGTSGSLSHSTTVTFHINGTSSNPPAYALVTSFGGQVYKYQNGTMTLIGQPVTTALRLIAWKPDGSYALIVGDSAVLLKWDGTTLTQISTSGVMSSGNDLNTVAWNPDGSYALMGGTDGDLLKYDGTSLTRVTDPNTHQIQGISWNPSGATALLVGNGGALFTYQSGTVAILNSGTTNDLYGVAWNPSGQYALISGANGSILRWDGTTVTVLNTSGLYPSTTIVRYVAWNSAGTQALLVGNAGGLVLSYDGTNLSVLTSGTSNGLFSLAWSGATATIVGNGGTMLTYSSGSFNTLATGVTTDLRGIAWKPT